VLLSTVDNWSNRLRTFPVSSTTSSFRIKLIGRGSPCMVCVIHKKTRKENQRISLTSDSTGSVSAVVDFRLAL
jgi:hypothetical protein